MDTSLTRNDSLLGPTSGSAPMPQVDTPEAGSDAARPTVKRNAKGHFLPGHAPRSPGRPPGVSAVERLSTVARELAKPLANAVSAVELARQCSPAVIARAVEIATTSRSETVALHAAELVLDRALGKPIESVALAHADMNAPSAAERHERAQAALARLREAFGRAALPAAPEQLPNELDDEVVHPAR